MKFNKNLLKEKWFSYTIALCSAVVLYLILTHSSGILHVLGALWHVGSPVFMAFVIAYVLGPLVNLYTKYVFHKIEQEKLRYSLSVLLAILSVILFVAILAVALVPQVIDSMVMFAGNLNGYVLSFQRLMRQLNILALQHDIDLSQFISSSDELLQSITQILPENLNKIVNFSYSFGAKMFDWVISFILAIYLMLDQAKLKSGFSRLLHALLPANVYRNTATFWSRVNKILLQYIAFDVLDGLIIGICNWVFMSLMHMPYVSIISVVVGITNLAPTFGPMAGAVIGAFILVLVKPWYAVVFVAFTMILQTLDGYVIKPRLFGGQLGVSSVWILISLIIGGRLLGVPGILLAIPFAAIGDFVYHDYFIKWLEKRNPDNKKKKETADRGLIAAASPVAEAVTDAALAAVAEVQKAADAAAEEIEKAADTAAMEIEKAADTAAVELEKAAGKEAAANAAGPEITAGTDMATDDVELEKADGTDTATDDVEPKKADGTDTATDDVEPEKADGTDTAKAEEAADADDAAGTNPSAGAETERTAEAEKA